MKSKNSQKAWVVAMDMGYGHQRAAYPLHHLAEGNEVIYADCYKGIPKRDREIWKKQRDFYNFISRLKTKPIIGNIAFSVFDHFQEIKAFYPKRDLSGPNLQTRSTYSLIKRKQWGRHLIKMLSKKKLPLITSFFVIAYMAEEFGYEGEIYLVVADADVSRAWAPLKPSKSRIKYFVPTIRVYERLQLYGVNKDNIYLTGFPLPNENIGGVNLKILKKDLGRRLINLDPKKSYIPKYKATLQKHLGKQNLINKSHHPLTIIFAVGGAGAQRETGAHITASLAKMLKSKKIKLILVAGVHNDVNQYFKDQIKKLGLTSCIRKSIHIIFSQNKNDYFKKFNNALRTSDILWTKPSELSFYCALGLPIIMSNPIGSQEKFNRKWLRAIGAGIAQENVKHTNEWLFDWLDSGWLAEAAMQGFFEATKYGTYNIENIIKHKTKEVTHFHTVLQY